MLMLSFLYGQPLPVGELAPDWTLPDQDGNSVTLRDLRGSNVVLIFYPRDETPVCRAQLCEFRDSFATVTAAGAQVFGINPGSNKSHTQFRDKLQLPFPLLVDVTGKVAEQYRAKGFLWPIRTVYLVGGDGRIRFSKRGKLSPHEVLAAVS